MTEIVRKGKQKAFNIHCQIERPNQSGPYTVEPWTQITCSERYWKFQYILFTMNKFLNYEDLANIYLLAKAMKFNDSNDASKNLFKENDLLLQNCLNLRLVHIVWKVESWFSISKKDERQITVCPTFSAMFVTKRRSLYVWISGTLMMDYIFSQYFKNVFSFGTMIWKPLQSLHCLGVFLCVEHLET